MHLLLWLETDDVSLLLSGFRGDIPKYTDEPFLHLMIRRHQIHTHGNYCKAQTKHCRFNFPKPIVNESYFDTSET